MNPKISLLDLEILLANVLGVDRSYLKAHPSRLLNPVQIKKLLKLLSRRSNYEPIAYLREYQYFWDLKLFVNKDVLIPRSETEIIIEQALSIIPVDSCCKVLELGTGSGAISLAIASERKNVILTATDVSIKALKVAKINAKNLKINNIDFLCCNWFTGIATKLTNKFDLIISNPPYIGLNEIYLCDLEILHEPSIALFSENNGFAALKNIISCSQKYLNSGGVLLLEHGFNQSKELIKLLELEKFVNIQSHNDLSGIARVLVATKM